MTSGIIATSAVEATNVYINIYLNIYIWGREKAAGYVFDRSPAQKI